MLGNVLNGIIYRLDFFSIFIRNLNIKFFFKSHYQLDRIQGIGTQIIHERSFRNNL